MTSLVEGNVVQDVSTACRANPFVTLNKGVSGDEGRGCILVPGGGFGRFSIRSVEPHVMWMSN
jgi:hypothetical protein